jgi:hypothetical protein
MGEEINNTDNTEREQKKRGAPEEYLFKKGESGNPAGRPKGSINFATKFRKFIEKVAEQNEITPEEVEEQLMAIGFKEAKGGNYSFWRDIHDRIYGRPDTNLDITTGGKELPTPIYGGFSLSRHNSDEEDIPAEKKD